MPGPTLSGDELLTTTRTVRRRLDLTREVPLGIVRECLEIALQAPTGSNRQHWHWIVVTDGSQRAALGAVYQRGIARAQGATPAIGSLFPDDPERTRAQQRVGDSAAYLTDHIGEVPVLVVACLDVGGELPTGNQAGIWGSLLPAAWSYMLAARLRGLGTAWTTGLLRSEAEAAEVLGLPSTVRQGVLIPTAYYTGSSFAPARRQPLDDVLHLDRW